MKTIRQFVMLFCLAALTACSPMTSSAPTSVSPAPAPGTPNIVLILTDDMTLSELEAMPITRALLGEAGVTFNRFFISMALCCPSRACILRGQYPHNTQIVGNVAPDGGFDKFHDLGWEESTVAVWLQAAGYRTALFGKYLNGYPGRQVPTYVPPGWTEWYSSPAKGDAYDEYNYTLNENGILVDYGNAPADYGTDVYAAKAADFIQRSVAAGEPFLAFISVYAPHSPSTPAARHNKLFQDARMPRNPSFNEPDVSDKPADLNTALLDDAQIKKMEYIYRKRLKSLQAVDEMVGNLVALLESLDELDNTYIFFTSDNGFHMGEHRMPPGKGTPYEEDIRVPLLVRGPDLQPGVVVDALTGNIDLAPTFADIAGVAVPAFVDGRSLLPWLRGEPIADWRVAFVIERGSQESASFTNFPFVLTPTADGLEAPDSERDEGLLLTYVGLRTENYTYVEYSNGEIELYDLQTDPYQLQNIASTADPALLGLLHEWLEALKQCKAESCRAIESRQK
jgi:arylsulfatase A-like enzyme